MIHTQRALTDVARLHQEILRERVEELHEAARVRQARLVEREEALARLRSQVAELRHSLNPVPPPLPVQVQKPKPVPAAVKPVPVPAKEADLDSARFTPASLPRPGTNRLKYAPYLAIAGFAFFIEWTSVKHFERMAPDLSSMARPAAAIVTNAKPAAKGAPVVADEDRSEEALLLVHEWILPGDVKSLGERLGGEIDLPGARPAWTVERTGEHGYKVSFQPDEKSVPLSFEADVEAKVVWPTAETQELLAPRFTAAFRDAVR